MFPAVCKTNHNRGINSGWAKLIGAGATKVGVAESGVKIGNVFGILIISHYLRQELIVEAAIILKGHSLTFPLKSYGSLLLDVSFPHIVIYKLKMDLKCLRT